jgi:hypothetical protein
MAKGYQEIDANPEPRALEHPEWLGLLLEVIKNLEGQESKLAIGESTAAFIERFGREYERSITNKWIGHINRRKQSIKTRKSHDVFVIPLGERERLRRLYDK